jgi:DNA (cytosine-5)-methyltransferase 1
MTSHANAGGPRVVDLFSGAGGFSTAARLAGCRVVGAVNHLPVAVAAHAENHPDALHGCYKLDSDTNYGALPDHDLLIASPCCQGFTRGRGIKSGTERDKRYDESRATLLAVTATAHAKRPKAVVVENVPEVRDWGRDGDGSRYRWWLDGFRVEGYRVSEHVLEAADFGVASRRIRLFITMVHESVAAAPVTVTPPAGPWVAARTVLDATGKYDGKFRPVADKVKKTRDKVARFKAGRMKDVHEWLFCYRGPGTALTLDEPLGTITTVTQWCLIRGDAMRFLAPDELRRAMGFPDDYRLPKTVKAAVKCIGNAVCPPVGHAVIRATLAAMTPPASVPTPAPEPVAPAATTAPLAA